MAAAGSLQNRAIVRTIVESVSRCLRPAFSRVGTMRYSRVFLDSLGYEIAPVVVSTAELERRIQPFLNAHGFPPPKLELLTGISERRWWEPNDRLSRGATVGGG